MGVSLLKEFTWKEVLDEARRMATFLQQQGFEPGARIAILSKNCAWWLMSDFAIWMAGYVSVPLYPTLAAGTIAQILAHSEARLVFVGKLDGWESMRPGVPPELAVRELPAVAAGRPRARRPAVGFDRRPHRARCPGARCGRRTISRPSCTPRARRARPRA
jgi:acyl-CoA synthetase (AMP-forming)/AMP-acid ligase II